jgi:hypothetical protein
MRSVCSRDKGRRRAHAHLRPGPEGPRKNNRGPAGSKRAWLCESGGKGVRSVWDPSPGKIDPQLSETHSKFLTRRAVKGTQAPFLSRRSCTTLCTRLAKQHQEIKIITAEYVSGAARSRRLILADGQTSVGGSLSIQPHRGITLTTRMRAYRQASRNIPFVTVRRDGGVWHRGPDRTHVGRS